MESGLENSLSQCSGTTGRCPVPGGPSSAPGQCPQYQKGGDPDSPPSGMGRLKERFWEIKEERARCGEGGSPWGTAPQRFLENPHAYCLLHKQPLEIGSAGLGYCPHFSDEDIRATSGVGGGGGWKSKALSPALGNYAQFLLPLLSPVSRHLLRTSYSWSLPCYGSSSGQSVPSGHVLPGRGP